jgi:plastocyanin
MMLAHVRRRSSVRALAVLAAGTLVLAGCFSGAPSTTGPKTPTIDCSSDAQPTDPNQAVVRIHDYAYHPADLTVSKGTTVTWVNCEGAGQTPHTSTSDDGLWDSGLISADRGTYAHPFGAAGSFGYHCSLHPFMKGTVTVQ